MGNDDPSGVGGLPARGPNSGHHRDHCRGGAVHGSAIGMVDPMSDEPTLRDVLRDSPLVTSTYCVRQFREQFGDKVWSVYVLWSDGDRRTFYDRGSSDAAYRQAINALRVKECNR